MDLSGKLSALLLMSVLVALALILSPAAEASTLTVFKGPNCSGKTKDVNSVCGCFDISGYKGGYHFVFTQYQKAYLHKSYNCYDKYPFFLSSEKRYCYSTGYNSVYMVC